MSISYYYHFVNIPIVILTFYKVHTVECILCTYAPSALSFKQNKDIIFVYNFNQFIYTAKLSDNT